MTPSRSRFRFVIRALLPFATSATFMASLLAPLIVVSSGSVAFAVQPKQTNPPRMRLKAGTEITVSKYLERSNVFEVTINRALDEGPNWATPEDLKSAIGLEGSAKDFVKRSLRDPSAVYVLKKELLLLWPVELTAREKKLKHH